MRIGITGHQRIEEAKTWIWVKQEFERLLGAYSPPLVGVGSLAIGSDQCFADAVLKHNGSLEIVIPFSDYETTFAEGHDRNEYFRLLAAASHREVLEKRSSNEESYLAAGKLVVDRSEVMLAVWNGLPANGIGGTGDIVNYALEKGRKLIHLHSVKLEVIEL
jgi:hypothetical protein